MFGRAWLMFKARPGRVSLVFQPRALTLSGPSSNVCDASQAGLSLLSIISFF